MAVPAAPPGSAGFQPAPRVERAVAFGHGRANSAARERTRAAAGFLLRQGYLDSGNGCGGGGLLTGELLPKYNPISFLASRAGS